MVLSSHIATAMTATSKRNDFMNISPAMCISKPSCRNRRSTASSSASSTTSATAKIAIRRARGRVQVQVLVPAIVTTEQIIRINIQKLPMTTLISLLSASTASQTMMTTPRMAMSMSMSMSMSTSLSFPSSFSSYALSLVLSQHVPSSSSLSSSHHSFSTSLSSSSLSLASTSSLSSLSSLSSSPFPSVLVQNPLSKSFTSSSSRVFANQDPFIPSAPSVIVTKRSINTNEGSTIPPPTNKQKWLLFWHAAIPMIGFGIIDQTIMIRAGNFIDCTIGVTFGLSTLTAAAFGQLCSDASGVLFGGTLESIAIYAGLPSTQLTSTQLTLPIIKRIRLVGSFLGVVLGCSIGLLNLLFIDTNRAPALKQLESYDDDDDDDDEFYNDYSRKENDSEHKQHQAKLEDKAIMFQQDAGTNPSIDNSGTCTKNNNHHYLKKYNIEATNDYYSGNDLFGDKNGLAKIYNFDDDTTTSVGKLKIQQTAPTSRTFPTTVATLLRVWTNTNTIDTLISTGSNDITDASIVSVTCPDDRKQTKANPSVVLVDEMLFNVTNSLHKHGYSIVGINIGSRPWTKTNTAIVDSKDYQTASATPTTTFYTPIQPSQQQQRQQQQEQQQQQRENNIILEGEFYIVKRGTNQPVVDGDELDNLVQQLLIDTSFVTPTSSTTIITKQEQHQQPLNVLNGTGVTAVGSNSGSSSLPTTSSAQSPQSQLSLNTKKIRKLVRHLTVLPLSSSSSSSSRSSSGTRGGGTNNNIDVAATTTETAHSSIQSSQLVPPTPPQTTTAPRLPTETKEDFRNTK